MEVQKVVSLVQPGVPVHTCLRAILRVDCIENVKASSQAEDPVQWGCTLGFRQTSSKQEIRISAKQRDNVMEIRDQLTPTSG